MKNVIFSLAAILALALAGYAGYRYAGHQEMATAPGATDKPVLYWYDPMYPQQKFDKPGKSPFMDMQLVPKYAGRSRRRGHRVASARRWCRTSACALPKRSAVRSSSASRRSARWRSTSAAWCSSRRAPRGFVEKLHARAPLDAVKKGAAARRDAVSRVGRRAGRVSAAEKERLERTLAQAARQRLMLLGMTEAQVAAVEREGRVQNAFHAERADFRRDRRARRARGHAR